MAGRPNVIRGHVMRDGRWLSPLKPSVSLRFWLKVAGASFEDCWEWQGCTESVSGYGAFTPSTGNTVKAHRYAYEEMVGPIPEGLHLDHLCRNRICVNPYHLEPVTCLVNVQRGARGRAAVTHCPSGHEYAGDNLRVIRGRRYCIACTNARNAARYLAVSA